MSTRKIKDAIDLSTNEKVYYKSHAKATFMSDGRTVEDAILAGGSGGSTPVIDHGTEDTTLELTSGVIHKWGLVSSLTLTVPEDSEGVVSQYRVVFTAGANFSLTLPETMVWSGGEMPEFETLKRYEFNIEGGRITFAMFEDMDDYELDWVENDGSDYVITDYVMSMQDYGVECKAAAIENGSNTFGAVAGSRISATSNTAVAIRFFNPNVLKIEWNGAAEEIGNYVADTDYVFEKRGVQNTITNNPALYLFAINQSDSTYYLGKFKIYYFRILGQDNSPRFDLRPYRSKGVIGFKDIVSGKFYPSVSGALIGGYNE